MFRVGTPEACSPHAAFPLPMRLSTAVLLRTCCCRRRVRSPLAGQCFEKSTECASVQVCKGLWDAASMCALRTPNVTSPMALKVPLKH